MESIAKVGPVMPDFAKLRSSFAFILNVVVIDASLSVEVAPGYCLRRASDIEVDVIKSQLASLVAPRAAKIYELVAEESGESGPRFCYSPERHKWRYNVISFAGSNAGLLDVEFAASLLKNDLQVGFAFVQMSKVAFGCLWNTAPLSAFFEEKFFPSPPTQLTHSELLEISENHKLIKAINPDHTHLLRAFEKFRDVKSLPRQSELVVIALFSVIESLIAHNPKSTEIGDSLGHQLQAKMPLLTKRFQRPLSINEYFEPASDTSLWKRLYEYRSKLVHGEDSKIDGNLRLLRDRETIVSFLTEAVKLLLLLALREPVLLTDLKNC